MTIKTNSELARAAELKVQILLAVEIPNVATSDLMPEVRKIIADTYAEAMAEAERLNDPLPITREWLQSIGFRPVPSDMGPGYDDHMERDDGVNVWEHNNGEWLFSPHDSVEMKTRGDFNRLLSWLDCPHSEPLPQPTEERT